MSRRIRQGSSVLWAWCCLVAFPMGLEALEVKEEATTITVTNEFLRVTFSKSANGVITALRARRSSEPKAVWVSLVSSHFQAWPGRAWIFEQRRDEASGYPDSRVQVRRAPGRVAVEVTLRQAAWELHARTTIFADRPYLRLERELICRQPRTSGRGLALPYVAVPERAPFTHLAFPFGGRRILRPLREGEQFAQRSYVFTDWAACYNASRREGLLFLLPERERLARYSLRFELLADGAEDYEYFNLLKKWARGATTQQTGRELTTQALKLLREVEKATGEYGREERVDPAHLPELRRRVGELLSLWPGGPK